MHNKLWHVPSSSNFIVVMAAESVSAAAQSVTSVGDVSQWRQSVTVAFDAGDAISEELGSCTISRKYVINSPRSCNTIQQWRNYWQTRINCVDHEWLL